MGWLVDYLAPRHNPAGSGRAAVFDGGPVRACFYSNGKYWNDAALVEVHRRAQAAGHEISNHTQNHNHGAKFSVDEWRTEIATCVQTFDKAGLNHAGRVGFRTPFLEYNAATFPALAAEGVMYDTTLQEGDAPAEDGKTMPWPYTLDAGSPGNLASTAADSPRRIAPQPGLWEIPLNVFRIPPDDACAGYGIPGGLQARVGAALKKAYNGGDGGGVDRITGLDWNVLEAAKCNGNELLAILKYTLDLRLAGNRAPFMVGGHTALYPASKPDRRRAIEEFVAYALTKPEVRFVTGGQMLDWMRAPQPLQAK